MDDKKCWEVQLVGKREWEKVKDEEMKKQEREVDMNSNEQMGIDTNLLIAPLFWTLNLFA